VTRLLAVLERDLRRMLRNPFTLLSSVMMPLLYLFILGNSLQGPVKGLALGVVAHDEGPEARRFIGALQAVAHGPRTVRLRWVGDAARAMGLLRAGELDGFVVVPPRFSSDLERGLNAAVGLYVDNVDSVAANALETAVTAVLPSLRTPIQRFELHRGAVQVLPQEVYPRVDYDTSLVPAVVVMAIFMGSMIAGGFNLVMDRFLGVNESYLSTPLTRLDLALGVLGSGTLVTLGSSTVVLMVGLLSTGAHVNGGAAGWAALVVVQLLTICGLMAMMMAVLGRASHPRVSATLGGALNVILFFPSGALYPISSFPSWLRTFSLVNPETHAIAALKAILFRSGDLAAATQHLVFLAAFAVAMAALATATLKRRL
jgi:ABC-2 type transport system permease protein